MTKPLSTKMQQQNKARRESCQPSPQGAVIKFDRYAAWSAEGKTQDEIGQRTLSSRHLFMKELDEMTDEAFERVRPALDAVIRSRNPEDLNQAVAVAVRAKVDAKIQAARAGREVDLSDLEIDERSAFFAAYYNKRTFFDDEKVKKENRLDKDHKKNFILRWIDKEFADRRKWNMMQSDLKKLDQSAWTRLQDWLRDHELPPDFSLPAKKNGVVRLKPSSVGMSRSKLIAKLESGEPVRPEDVRAITRDGVRASRLKKFGLT